MDTVSRFRSILCTAFAFGFFFFPALEAVYVWQGIVLTLQKTAINFSINIFVSFVFSLLMTALVNARHKAS
jgi:hypothetical protein